MPPLRSILPALAALALVTACGAGPRRFESSTPMWVDEGDRRPFRPQPDERYAPRIWDAADNMIFRPAARALVFELHGEARDVNALDEVPDSSWFVNRIGRHAMTPEQVAVGPCEGVEPPVAPWTVVGGKVDGATSGFTIEDAEGRRFLLKADRARQPEQATAADAIGSRLYHAAGYHVPCNRVVAFDPGWLTLAEDAEIDPTHGAPRPMTREDLDEVLARMVPSPGGLRRAVASAFIDGIPVGPWDYRGTWDRDLNDVVPHEDRRELRALFVLNAWIDNWDARQHNTLAAWQPRGPEGAGYVRHYLVDFGAALGFVQGLHRQQVRYGRTQWLDTQHVVEDLFTFGIPTRPWDVVERGPTWPIFGYFGVERFEPDQWRPNYWNGAFERMTERDAAWMARIIARFTPEHVDALVGVGRLTDPAHRARLRYVLNGRRRAILERWLTRLSPLADPTIDDAGRLCLRDLAIVSGLRDARGRRYRAWTVREDGGAGDPVDVAHGPREVCLRADVTDYAIVRVAARTAGRAPTRPIDVHLRRVGDRPRVVGLERREDAEAWR